MKRLILIFLILFSLTLCSCKLRDKASDSEATEPVEPTATTEPLEPEEVTEPVVPAEATEPVEPEEMTEPVEPDEVPEPVASIEATEPVESAEKASSTGETIGTQAIEKPEHLVKSTFSAEYPESTIADITDANGQNLILRDYDSYFYTGNDIVITLHPDTLTDTGIDFTFVNYYDELGSSELIWNLQKKIGGEWYCLNYTPEFIDSDEFCSLEELAWSPGSYTETYNFDKIYGSLEPGEYRIIFCFTTPPDDNSVPRYGYIFLPGEFTVE